MKSLFDDHLMSPCRQELEPGAVILRGYAKSNASLLLEEVWRIAQASPFRHMVTPGGRNMSVAMTNCGRVGWISEPTGYRYGSIDPHTAAPWPAMPDPFKNLIFLRMVRTGTNSWSAGNVGTPGTLKTGVVTCYRVTKRMKTRSGFWRAFE